MAVFEPKGVCSLILPITAFIFSFCIVFLILKFQHLHAHFSADNDLISIQKFHVVPVPRVGGVGIFCGIILSEFIQFFLESESEGPKFGLLLLLSAMPAFFTGLIEDLTKKIGIAKRLWGTITSALLCGFFLGGWLTTVDVYLLDIFLSFHIISVFVTCFAITGVANSFNLIDGYNGLSSIVGIIILLGLIYVAGQVGDSFIANVALITVGSILGFVFWNYPKGLIFLGDGGAYLIGFIIAELSLLLVVRNSIVSPWFPLLLNFYPIFETIFSIFRRVIKAKSHPGLPDANHLHQLIYRKLFEKNRASFRYSQIVINSITSPFLWVLCLMSVIPAAKFWMNTNILFLFCVLFGLTYVILYFVLQNKNFQRTSN